MLAASNSISLKRRIDQAADTGSLILGLIVVIVATKSMVEGDSFALIPLIFGAAKIGEVATSVALKKCTGSSECVNNFYSMKMLRLVRPILAGTLVFAYLPLYKSKTLEGVSALLIAEAILTLLRQSIEIALHWRLLSRSQRADAAGAGQPLLAINDDGRSAFQQAIIRVVAENNWEDLDLLIGLGDIADVDMRYPPRDDVTSLHIAVANQNPRLVRTLLELGADPNIANQIGITPLHYALALRNYDLINMLMEGTDVTRPAVGHLNYILALIFRTRWITEALNAHRLTRADAVPITTDETPRKMEVLRALRTRGAPFNMHEESTYAHIFNEGDATTINVLAAAFGSEIFNGAFDAQGNTALHKAAQRLNFRIMQALLDLGLPFGAMNNEGQTALNILMDRHARALEENVRTGRGQAQLAEMSAMIAQLRELAARTRRGPAILAMAYGFFMHEESAVGPEGITAGS